MNASPPGMRSPKHSNRFKGITMNTASYIETLALTNSEVELEDILNAVKKRVSEIREEKSAEARQQVSDLINKYGYTALGLTQPKAKNSAPTKSRPKKYRDPATGATWSGSGGLPYWVGDRVDLNLYLNPDWVVDQDAKKAAKKAK